MMGQILIALIALLHVYILVLEMFLWDKPYGLKAFGGSGEIRTHGGLTPSSVFKTGALNRSATLPWALSYK